MWALTEALRSLGDFGMNGSILAKIQDGELELSLLCDTLEEQEALEPIMVEIRRVMEEALESVGAEGLVACVRD